MGIFATLLTDFEGISNYIKIITTKSQDICENTQNKTHLKNIKIHFSNYNMKILNDKNIIGEKTNKKCEFRF
jgi:hypothetical protein